MATGKVKWFNDAKGFGFICAEDCDKDIFVHHTSIESDGYRSLSEGEEVQFELVAGEKGPKAEKVVKMQT